MLKIAVMNNKGGVGKTLFATLLVSYLQGSHGSKLCAVDLDPQRDFELRLTGGNIPIPLVFSLNDIPENMIAIIDTPPAVSDISVELIRAANLVIIPTRGDLPGVQRAAKLYDLCKEASTPARIILNEFTKIPREEKALKWLQVDNGYGDNVLIFPHLKSLVTNLDNGLPWNNMMRHALREEITKILDSMLKVS